ncbi:SRPBCC family protein [Marinicellulosiphila megalodicopiae]|uniref:SRPBCC family protein n=1 Tax=Marinicellulosiphila megalodicopiae TaxID=2724896 RepID=UPI003BAE23E2
MREIKSESQINAPIDKVWSVLTDINNWESWNPGMKGSGRTIEGNSVTIEMIDENGNTTTKYEPLILDVNAPKYFRWKAKMMAGFMFTNERVFELSENENGVLLINKETFSGLMVPLFWGKMQGFVGPTLDKMNVALKEKVEKIEK